MLEINMLREQKERVIEGLKKRNISEDLLGLVDQIIQADDSRKSTQTELDQLLADSNQTARDIGILYKEGKNEKANQLKVQVSAIKDTVRQLESKLKSIKETIDELLIQLPNVPHSSVPNGTKAEDNEIYKSWD